MFGGPLCDSGSAHVEDLTSRRGLENAHSLLPRARSGEIQEKEHDRVQEMKSIQTISKGRN